jgi:hypothetical protein
MSVPGCTLCERANQTPTSTELAAGDYCPICYKPTCSRHLATVRFRWRETRQTDSAQICRECKDSYQHRYWDSARRDWIS